MKKGSTVAIILIVLIVLGAGFYALTKTKDEKPTTTNTTQSSDTTSEATDTPSMQVADETGKTATATITYSSSGFSPSSITVKTGEIIEVKNNSSGDVQFESDPHPVHTDNKQLNLDIISAGKTRTFSISNSGSWGYHNHLDSSQTGTIIVQ